MSENGELSTIEALFASVVRECEVNGVKVFVRPMTIDEMVSAESISGDNVADNMGKVAKIVAGCLCNEDGDALAEGISTVEQRVLRLGPQVLAELFQECCSATGITEESQDELVKN